MPSRETTRRIPGAVVPAARRIHGVLLAGLRAVGAKIAGTLGRRPVRPRDRGGLGVAHGAVPAGVTVFDDAVPAVARLDPALLSALRRAGAAAAAAGIELRVNSGWRSPEYQSVLLREAVTKYGSEAEAARWVATPETSAHVAGEAVDIGPPASASWLSEHGAEYGLCRIYRNEPWHYELRPEAIEHGCPPRYADPSHDPRMRR
ncbi:M15 family metallopeptidase [Amycolatopsis sp. NPDC021455]|uniref:M15 family metallopeptidase n=1 Tax=Amycolatopsis sp. NPDC021455 TaxID=3154901 RepID=UPI0033F3787D